MPSIGLTPTSEFPVPYDDADESPVTFEDEMAVAANTAELQTAMGAPVDVFEAHDAYAAQTLPKAITAQNRKAFEDRHIALAAAQFLREYGSKVALDVAKARSAITYKLLELANCGDPKHELRALELLGKHSDIGLFTERSEITIKYKDPTELEEAIKERLRRLMGTDLINVSPTAAKKLTLEEELSLEIAKANEAEEAAAPPGADDVEA